MEKQINLTCKRSERTIEYLSFDKPRTFVQKGYEVYNGDEAVCFISKCDSLGEWNANSFDDYENCEGLVGGLTKKEVLENIERLLRQGTLFLTWDERKAKRRAEQEEEALEAINQTWSGDECEVSEKETKSDEALLLFNELDDDGLVDTNHYDEALCQKQNVQYHWDDDLSVGDIDTVIEYFKTLKQLIKLERKVSKLAIFG